MTELDDTEPRPCSVCAALVRSTDMQAHMDWHAEAAPSGASADATADPTGGAPGDSEDARTERP